MAFQTLINPEFEAGEFLLLNSEKQPILRIKTDKDTNLNNVQELANRKIALEKEKIFSVRFLN
jgi:hypothetical protein